MGWNSYLPEDFVDFFFLFCVCFLVVCFFLLHKLPLLEQKLPVDCGLQLFTVWGVLNWTNIFPVLRSSRHQGVLNCERSFGTADSGAPWPSSFPSLTRNYFFFLFVATWTVKTGMCCVWKKGKGEIKKFNRVKKPFHLTLLSLLNHTKLWVYAVLTNSVFIAEVIWKFVF